MYYNMALPYEPYRIALVPCRYSYSCHCGCLCPHMPLQSFLPDHMNVFQQSSGGKRDNQLLAETVLLLLRLVKPCILGKLSGNKSLTQHEASGMRGVAPFNIQAVKPVLN